MKQCGYKLWPCDPEKNKGCTQEMCSHTTEDGTCMYTRHERFSLNGSTPVCLDPESHEVVDWAPGMRCAGEEVHNGN